MDERPSAPRQFQLTRRYDARAEQAAAGREWARRIEGELNEQQLAAVTAPDGPVLVLAGAGSGKTRVITYRVAYLIGALGVAPHAIMLTTFTNKAAREMLRRAEQVVGAAAREVSSGTFHHIANLLLRRHGPALGYDRNFTILDESDARQVMKLARVEVMPGTLDKAFPSERLLLDAGSAMINTASALDMLLSRRYPQLMEFHDEIARVLIEYGERKRRANQMDFDDLLVNMLKLLTEQPAVRRELGQRFSQVLVDEYQDVNHVQGAIVRELYLAGLDGDPAGSGSRSAEKVNGAQRTMDREEPGNGSPLNALRDWDDDELPPPQLSEDANGQVEAGGAAVSGPQNESRAETPAPPEPFAGSGRGLFVVGDDAQSIYSFRGADYANIRRFPEAFPGARVFKLETNYRSTPQVLALANAVLQDADPVFRKELLPVKPDSQDRPMLLACRDIGEQAEFIAEQILALREESGIAWRQMAVLYRAHNNRLEIELELTKRRVPFIVRGGVRFFEQAHIKDLLSYIVVLANGRDELAWQRMLGMVSRVGPKTIADVLRKLRANRREDDERYGGPLGRFNHNGVADSVKGGGREGLVILRGFLRQLAADAEQSGLPASDLIRRVLDERYKAYLELTYDNWRQRLDDLEQLIVYAGHFDTLQGFLAEIGLNGSFAGSDIVNPDSHDEREDGAVTLSTVHQAKGLEWRAVFIVSVQDDVIPHRMTRSDPDGEDEERRLLYVAVTRAEELLYMSYPQMTETRDFQRLINRPSRFLLDLPKGVYDEAVLEWG